MRLQIIAIILISLLVFGCTAPTDNTNTTQESNLQSTEKDNLAVNQPIANTSPTETIETDWASEIKSCEHCSYSLGVCTYDSTCLYGLVEKIEDCSEINSLVGYSSKKFAVFEDRCIAQLAIKKTDIDICLKANTKIGDCAPSVVSSVADFDLCDQIDGFNLNNYSTKQCYLDIAKKDLLFDVKTCDEIFGLEYNECYKTVAITQNNLELCGKLSNNLEKQKCQDEYALKNRVNDVLLCNIFSNPGACARDVLVELGDQVTKIQCGQLRDEVTGTGHDTYSNCFNTVALRDLDLDSCNQIKYNDFMKEECINKVNHVLEAN